MICYTYDISGSAGHTTLAELAVVRRGGVPMAAARPVMVKMNISLGNQLVTKALSEGVGSSETVRPLTSKFATNSQNAQDNSKKSDTFIFYYCHSSQ